MIPFDDLSTGEQTRYTLAYLYFAHDKTTPKSEILDLLNCVGSDLFVNSVIPFDYRCELLADAADFYINCRGLCSFWLTRLSMLGL